jgi:hypothetical protein
MNTSTKNHRAQFSGKATWAVLFASALAALVAVFVFPFTSTAQTAPSGQTVTTDKADYPPGGIVQIAGSGFTPGEVVVLQVVHLGEGIDDDLTNPAHWPWEVIANANGGIQTTWVVPDSGFEGGATLLLTAYGNTSNRLASTTFTDGNIEIRVAPIGVASFTTNLTITGQVAATTNLTNDGTAYSFGMGNPQSATLTVSPVAGGRNFISWTNVNSAANGGIVVSTLPSITINGQNNSYYANYDSKLNQIITFNPNPFPNRTYGDADFTVNATASSGLTVSYSILTSPASGVATLSENTVTIVGAGVVTITANQAGNATYNAAPSVERSFTVNPKTVMVTPNAGQTKVFGPNDPTFTYTLSESITVSGALARAAGENVGSYAINLGTLASVSGNYVLTLSTTPVNFTITPKPVTVTPNAGQTKVFGASDPTLTYALSEPVTVSGALARAAGEDAGSYAINLGTLASVSGNYVLTLAATPVNFTITPKPVTVTLGDLTQTYTGSALTPTAVTSPVANLAIIWTNAPQTNAGTYAVTATVNDPNYVGASNGTFLINKAPVTVTLSNLTQTYTGSALTPTVVTSPVANLAITWTNAPQTNAGSYAVTATVNNPNYDGTASGTFLINKAPVTVTLSNLTQTYTGSALTPTAVTSPVANLAITWTNAPQTNAGSYTVTATVNNPNYVGASSGTFVIDKATLFATITGPASGSIYPVKTEVNFSGTYSGGHGIDPLTITWNFDNLPSLSGGTVFGSGSFATTFPSPAFQTAGVYNVSVTVAGGSNYNSFTTNLNQGIEEYVVIYDPSAGFVTGGGWITSPAGALVGSNASGRANFGFVSKYAKGANKPTGETEFNFKTGNMNFHSTAYEWLVVGGAKAQYKGTGTINGTGNYGFILTAVDSQVNGGGNADKFRIKIWDNNNNDAPFYDNQVGTLDTADSAEPITALGGGNIVIHAK